VTSTEPGPGCGAPPFGVERDLATPSTTALRRLSEVLDVPISYFFEPSGERRRPND
jgi:transcriptional regulator with XRE-family HTH domain